MKDLWPLVKPKAPPWAVCGEQPEPLVDVLQAGFEDAAMPAVAPQQLGKALDGFAPLLLLLSRLTPDNGIVGPV